jgi:nucleoside-diphosphate-sugar epimerase
VDDALVSNLLPLCPGASGVLGTAVYDSFAQAGAADHTHTVLGLANSRPGGERNHRKLNLLDSDAVSTFIRQTAPNCKFFSA